MSVDARLIAGHAYEALPRVTTTHAIAKYVHGVGLLSTRRATTKGKNQRFSAMDSQVRLLKTSEAIVMRIRLKIPMKP